MKKMLTRPTVPIPVGQGKSIDDILSEMKLTAFQGRKLAETVDVWSRMLRKRRTVIWFGFAGAMIPAGMRRLLAYL
ncbi:MAG: deoxyhypusine synthase family protein, partial [Candidatus Bathyarchaeota archaeon]|nr:deoxyhypusine synthase family protein [Candidatus Bathyarchaeota archaeon]